MIRDNIYSAHKVRISNDDLGCVDNVRAKAGILSPVSIKLYEYYIFSKEMSFEQFLCLVSKTTCGCEM